MNDMTTPSTTIKHFSLEEATAMLPLVRSIVTDICGVFRNVTSRRLELHRLLRKGSRGAGRVYDDEMAESRADLQAEYDQIWQYREELESLGVVLRQPEEGLIEFPTKINTQEAFFSWQLGESAIVHYRLASESKSARWPLDSNRN
jgi:hypothetical protein